MSTGAVWAWYDREGRVWMDTGYTDPKTSEMLLDLVNGAARGRRSWVEKEFGPLQELGDRRPKPEA